MHRNVIINHICSFSALLVLISPLSPAVWAQGASSSPWFLGEWHIAGFRLTGASALDSAEAAEWIGRPVRINASSFIFDKDTCSQSTYVSNATDADEFFLSVYRLPPMTIGITNRIIQVTAIRCADLSPQTLISQNNSDLMIENMGVFFELKRGKGSRRAPVAEISPEEQLRQAHKQALALSRAGKKKEAAKLLADAAGSPPWVMYADNIGIFDDLGRILVEAGEFQLAFDVLSIVLDADPDRTYAYLFIGDAYAGVGDEEHARSAYLHYAGLMEQAGKKKQIPARIVKLIK